MLKVFGQCYEIRERLKSLGCVWDAQAHCWFAPDDRHAQAQTLADAENRREWLVYCGTLVWVKGELTPTIWNASLRAASLKIPAAECYALCEARVRGAGAAVKPARIERDVRRAYESIGDPLDAVWRPDAKAEKQAKPVFRNEELAHVAGSLAGEVDLGWLADRSPVDPFTVTPHDYLSALYEPGERVVVFDVFESQGTWLWGKDEGGGLRAERRKRENAEHPTPNSENGKWQDNFERSEVDWDRWYDRTKAPELRAGREFDARGPEGIWYLCNPVDGVFRKMEENDREGRPKWSRRFEKCVTSYRNIVLESDKAAARDWVAMVVQMPLRISAIYTSGGKSVHVLVRLDAKTKVQWDGWREEIMPILVTLGADRMSMSGVRLTRLPQCRRGGEMQKLLYLNPSPDMTPIASRCVLRDATGPWVNWAQSLVQTHPEDRDPEEVERCLAGLDFYASMPAVAAWRKELRR